MTKKNSSNSSKGICGNIKQISPSKHWFLTLNNYSKEDIIVFSSDSSIERYCFQEEIGDSGTPHLQGHFEFKKKIRPLGHFKDMLSNHPRWEKTKHRRAAIEYCSKLDSRNGKTYIKGFPKSLFRKINVLSEDNLYDWQKEVLSIVREVPDDRTIHWYWDVSGGKGKSALVKYLVVNEHAIKVSGKGSDIKYMLAKCELPPDIVIYDIPRQSKNYVNYAVMEEIKDEVFCSSKYESLMIQMPAPHVICFANFEPDFGMMSVDRWKVTKL